MACVPTARFFVAILAASLSFLILSIPALAEPFHSEGDVPIAPGFQRQVLANGLVHPWSMAWLPGGDILITERPGRLRLYAGGVLQERPIGGVPEVFASGQGGLLDIAPHPNFIQNRQLYFTYTAGTPRANHTRVARAEYDGVGLRNWTDLFEVSQKKHGTQHFGSRLLWLPDGTLLVSIGDGGNPPLALDGDLIRKQAQSKMSHLGKILRLTADGTPAGDNPFVDDAIAKPEIFSLGHRNVQGLDYDPLRKRIWATEHGALGGDELNEIESGANYGWPLVTFSREYIGGFAISEQTSAEGKVDPVAVWLNAIAPSGLTLYTGDRYPGWRGDVFAGALVKQEIRHLDLDAAGNVLGEDALRIGQRVRDVRQGPDDLLYVLTDEDDGKLIRLLPIGGGDTAP